MGINVGWALSAKEADEATRQRVLETYGRLPLIKAAQRQNKDPDRIIGICGTVHFSVRACV
ncbi:hypothetical protein KKH56_02920 [bacterium]|nr:hypothetical protein [bacterium]